MRKVLISLLLPLLLLLSQQGALWHEIGHLAAPDTTQPADQGGKPQPIDRLCESCLSFAHLAAAATPFVAPLPLAGAGFARPLAEAILFLAADAPRARSRGPPAVL